MTRRTKQVITRVTQRDLDECRGSTSAAPEWVLDDALSVTCPADYDPRQITAKDIIHDPAITVTPPGWEMVEVQTWVSYIAYGQWANGAEVYPRYRQSELYAVVRCPRRYKPGYITAEDIVSNPAITLVRFDRRRG